nr:hypothetical protein [Pseudodesulfovibrio sp.]
MNAPVNKKSESKQETEAKTEKPVTKYVVPSFVSNREFLVERFRIQEENEALLKAKKDAKVRARILLPRALKIIAMEIEGYARELPTNRQLYKAVKDKINDEMENYLTEAEKRKRIRIKSFFDAFYRFNIFSAIVVVTYSIFFVLMDMSF